MSEFTFTFSKDPLKLGDYDSKYGQSYWSDVEEDTKPVKFNLMEEGVEFRAGDKISCDESLNKRSGKGTDYLQLRKVRIVYQSQPQAPRGAQGPISGSDIIVNMLKEINGKLDKLMGEDGPPQDIVIPYDEDGPPMPPEFLK